MPDVEDWLYVASLLKFTPLIYILILCGLVSNKYISMAMSVLSIVSTFDNRIWLNGKLLSCQQENVTTSAGQPCVGTYTSLVIIPSLFNCSLYCRLMASTVLMIWAVEFKGEGMWMLQVCLMWNLHVAIVSVQVLRVSVGLPKHRS